MSNSESGESDFGGLNSSLTDSNNRSFTDSNNRSFISSKLPSLRSSMGQNSLNNSALINQSGKNEIIQNTPQYINKGDMLLGGDENKKKQKYFDSIGSEEQDEERDQEENKKLLNLIEEKYKTLGFNKKDFHNEFKPN